MSYPGQVSKQAEDPQITASTTIAPTSDLAVVTGTTAIATIIAPLGTNVGQKVILIPLQAFTTVTTGNIAIASTAVVGKALQLVFAKSTGKWYPSY